MSTRFEHRRLVRPELLDDADPAEARRSLADLRRINRYFGGHFLLQRLFREQAGRSDSFTALDVGAGSGDNGRALEHAFPNCRVTSLDYRLVHLAEGQGSRVAGDAFRLPFRDGAFDFTLCSLFLHHFSNEQVVLLLEQFRRAARRAIILTDLERGPFAHRFIPATRWLFRWHPITVHDAPVSVQAGFSVQELESLAKRAGLTATVRRHRPWSRLSLVAPIR